MFVKVVKTPGRLRDEAEKPFWISFADLMTALMVLFLVVMSVALLAITKRVSEQERRKAEHEQEIDKFFERLEAAASHFPEVKIDRKRQVINFGSRAQFDLGRYHLTPDQGGHLRAFVPSILDLALSPAGH